MVEGESVRFECGMSAGECLLAVDRAADEDEGVANHPPSSVSSGWDHVGTGKITWRTCISSGTRKRCFPAKLALSSAYKS